MKIRIVEIIIVSAVVIAGLSLAFLYWQGFFSDRHSEVETSESETSYHQQLKEDLENIDNEFEDLESLEKDLSADVLKDIQSTLSDTNLSTL